MVEILNKLVDKLMNMDNVDITQNQETEKIGVFKRDFGMDHFDWPQGVGLIAIYNMYLNTKDSKYLEYINNWFLNQFEKGLPSKNINTTIPLYTLLDINQIYKNDKYEKLIKDYRDFLMNELPRTTEGGFEHITSSKTSKDDIMRHEEQLWVDTVFMSVLFLNKYGTMYNDKDASLEALKQIKLHIKYLFNKDDSLFYHGYSFKRNDYFGACYWGRGNSWMTLGIPIFIRDSNLQNHDKDYLTSVLSSQIEKLSTLLDDGMFHTILDDKTSYVESSGTAGIIAGIKLSNNLGLLNKDYSNLIEESLNSLVKRVDSDGNLNDVSCGTGIYLNKEDYKKVIKKPMAYGQSLLIIAITECLKESSIKN